MESLKKYFPTAFKSTEKNAFIIALVIYILIDVVCGAVIGLLSSIAVIGVLNS